MNNQYKIKSPFRYPGGKFYALKYLLPYVEKIPHNEFREVFVGGGSVFFGKRPSEYSWLNDIDKELINVFKIIQSDRLSEELIKMIRDEVASKERHCQVKSIRPQTRLDRAFKYYYLNRTSYSGIMHKPAWGYKIGKSSPPQNWGNMILSAKTKLTNVILTAKDFEEIINADPISKGNQVLLYLDPPYLATDQKRAYANSFSMKEHLRLCNTLKKTKHWFLLSYDDNEEIRELYHWTKIIELTWNYNTSNIHGKNRKKGEELLITNYPI